MPTNQPSFIQEYLWRPLIHVQNHQLAYLVHPGSTLPPQVLEPGWQWRWPLLTSVRVVHSNPVTITIGQSSSSNSSAITDEPITAVSRDHQLYTLEGTVIFRLNPQAPPEVLSQFNRHSVNRLIRPLIRQTLRQATGQIANANLTPVEISQRTLPLLQQQGRPYGLIIDSVTVTAIQRFLTKVPQR